jgi:branched-chain amino acid transport system substrate-binding protein
MKRRVAKRGFELVAVLLTFLFIFYPASVKAQRPIKVGVIDTYTGPPAVFANDALNGFKLALGEINKKGVLGTKIEFTTRDDKWEVGMSLTMAKELVMRENVDVIVGTINSAVALAVSDYVKGEKCPLSFGFRRVSILQDRKVTGMSSLQAKIRLWVVKQELLVWPKNHS